MIAALVSSWRDPLLPSAVESARAAGLPTLVFDGPADGSEPRGGHVEEHLGSTVLKWGSWESDAAKRTAMLHYAKHWHRKQNSVKRAEELWVLWLDSDEVLLWGEYLVDWVRVAEETAGGGGFPIRLVELDGSVVMCQGKIIKASVVRKYLHSSYQVELHNGMVVALPNVPICTAGGMPNKPEGGWVMPPEEMDVWLARHRPPVAGEPHLLHRAVLRGGSRADVRRLSEVEGEWFDEAISRAGLE